MNVRADDQDGQALRPDQDARAHAPDGKADGPGREDSQAPRPDQDARAHPADGVTDEPGRAGQAPAGAAFGRVPWRDPVRIERAVRFVERVLVPYHRARVHGLERIPDGPGIYVGNHNGGLYSGDTYLFGAAVLRARGLVDVPYALAHDTVVSFPPLARALVPLGAVRADTETATGLLAAGAKVLTYPGGDVDNARTFAQRNQVRFGGRAGYVRLALSCGVPVIPVVAAGAHSTFVVLWDGAAAARLLRTERWLRLRRWPLVLSVPLGLTWLPSVPFVPFPARITVEVGAALRFDRSGPEAAADEAYVRMCAARVERVMQGMLDRLSGRRDGAPPSGPRSSRRAGR